MTAIWSWVPLYRPHYTYVEALSTAEPHWNASGLIKKF